MAIGDKIKIGNFEATIEFEWSVSIEEAVPGIIAGYLEYGPPEAADDADGMSDVEIAQQISALIAARLPRFPLLGILTEKKKP